MSDRNSSLSIEDRQPSRTLFRFSWTAIWAACVGMFLLFSAIAVIGHYFSSPMAWPNSPEAALRAAIAEFKKAIALDPSLQEGYAGLSEAYELQGNTQAALATWEQAIAANPDQAWPYIGLAKFYTAQGMDDEAFDAWQQALCKDPIFVLNTEHKDDVLAHMLGLSTPLPSGSTYEVRQTLSNGWLLLGYRVDEAALARGEAADLLLFWRAPLGLKPDEGTGTWHGFEDQFWVQILPATRSLLEHGDFEVSALHGDIPGFPIPLHDAPPSTRRLEPVIREGMATHALALETSPGVLQNGLSTSDLPVSPNTVYLQTGWMQSFHGQGYLGWEWHGAFPGETPPSGYSTQEFQSEAWQHVVGLAEPPPHTKTVRIQLRNEGATGLVRFDDVTWIPIPNPVDIHRFRTQIIQAFLEDPAVIDDPEWLLSLGGAGPAVPLTFDTGQGWIFRGYTTDESALAAGEPSWFIGFWQGPKEAKPGPEKDGWRLLNQDQGLWAQILENVTSEVVNGNFEQGNAKGLPVGFTQSLYKNDGSARRLQQIEREGRITQAAFLANNEKIRNASFISDPVPVREDYLYLEGAWVYAPQGRAYIGYQWKGALPKGEKNYGYIATARVCPTWCHVVGIVKSPPGSQTLQIRLLNYKSMHPVAFDDVWLLALQPPRKP